MQNMLTEAYIIIVLALIMVLINIRKNDYRTMIAPFAFLVLSMLDIYFVKVRRSRRFSVVATSITIIIVFTYCILFVTNGFAFLWTLLIPLSVCYMFGVKEGIILSAYFQALYMIAFYTPVRRTLEGHFSTIILDRFPILFFFNALITCYVMYQYHKSALFEIDYASRLNEEVARQTAASEEKSRKIEKMSLQTIETLANAIDAKDPYTRGHSRRVAMYAAEIAKRMHLPENEVQNVYYAGLLHDAGKISIPDAVLNKPGRLTDEEMTAIRNHTVAGGNMLKQMTSLRGVRETALYHHERFDGLGYPEGLKGEQIPLYARIVGVADSYDAMSSNRVYRRHLNKDEIIEEIQKGSGTQFDPDIVVYMVDMINDGYVNVVKMETVDSDDGSDRLHLREEDIPGLYMGF